MIKMAGAALTVFTNIAEYTANALPILQQDLTLNTVCISELALLKPGAEGSFMGIINKCSSCPAVDMDCAVFSPGAVGPRHRLLVSAPICQHAAQLISQLLQDLPCSSLTTTAETAALIAASSSLQLQLRHKMNLMLLNPQTTELHSSPAVAASSPADSITASLSTAATPTAAAAVTVDGSSSQQPADLELRALFRDKPDDVNFIMSWSSEFAVEAMKLSAPPPDSHVQGFVTPWLQQGQYFVAQAAGQPVCMLCHVPTGSSSSRIVWVYTPAAHRRQGHARSAVRELCIQLQKQGISHICLMASQENPTANRVYQDVGFATVGEIHTATKPDHIFGF